MRRLCAISIVVALDACSAARRPAVLPDADAPARLAAAERLVEAGCYDCLVSAYDELSALRRIPAVASDAGRGAIRAAGLAAVRERELGMADGGYLAAARAILPEISQPSATATLLDILDLLPASVAGVSRPPASEEDLRRARQRRANRDAHSALLREAAPADLLAAYAWTTYMCASDDPREIEVDQIFAVVSRFRDTPLLRFRRATCRRRDDAELEAIGRADARWVEIDYLAGLAAVGRRDLDGAQKLFDQAYRWHPKWPALTQSLGNLALTAEEFETAARYYDETLSLQPAAVDAQLGKLRASTYLERRDDAIAAADVLIAGHWYVGDARYWRALNETQIARYDDAWDDIEEAAKLLINAEVPKLAGIIAYRRQQLDTSRARFELSRQRNPADCETGFYLGTVLADQRNWVQSADVLTSTATCLQQAEARLVEEIAAIRASAEPAARQARQIARREREIANGRRMLATSWFNTAVAYFSLQRASEARQYAEKVVGDEQFGDRAREILSRLK